MSIEYRKSVDIKHSVDVVVAGGGPAGVSAAFSAAMCGKNVLIIEQSGTFGGSSMLCNVPELMNFDDGESLLLSKKICRELRSAWNNYWTSQEG